MMKMGEEKKNKNKKKDRRTRVKTSEMSKGFDEMIGEIID